MLRRTAEYLLRDWTRLRHLPAQFGGLPIHVSSAGGLSQLLRPMVQVEPELLATAKALVKPGATVWDIGANVGLFSVASAACSGPGGKVFSFEPDTALIALLRRTALLQPATAAQMTIVPCGVAGTTGFRSFAIASRARASNALSEYGNTQTGGSREMQTIACFSPDDLLAQLPKPDVVKIDVEGAEIELLSAAKGLLHEARPMIACEVAPANSRAVFDILVAANYVLFDGVAGFSSGAAQGTAPWNTIAVPKIS